MRALLLLICVITCSTTLGLPPLAAAEAAAEAAPTEAEAEATPAEGATAPAEDAAAATGGEEEATVKTGATFFEKLKQGGVIVVVLLAISVALLSFALERIQNLKRAHILPEGFVDEAKRLWAAKQFKTLRQRCEADGSTLASIVRSLVMHRKSEALELSQVAGDIASQDMRHHMQKLIPFALIATISPLLGLLGTVSGMIDSFEVVAIAGSLGDASILADGIAKALVTTAVGLIVAVPAIALFNYFKVRTTRLALALDGEVNQLISEWFIEEVEDEDEEAA